MAVKRSIPAADIQKYLEQVLKRHACVDVIVTRVYELETKASNWNADCAHKSGIPIPKDCLSIFETAKRDLQNRYTLLVD